MGHIGEIIVHDYRKPFGESERHNLISNLIREAIRNHVPSLEIDTIDVYNFDHEKQNLSAGRKGRRLVMLHNATEGVGSIEPVTYDEGAIINGIQTPYTSFLLPTGIEANTVIRSTEGLALAEYNPEREEFNILFDLLNDHSNLVGGIFVHIMKEFERLVCFPKTLENSWLHTNNKEALTSRFQERMKRMGEDNIRNYRNNMEDAERRIHEMKQEIKRYVDVSMRMRRNMETEQNHLNSVGEKLIHDLDLISNNPKVTDLHIINGIFHVYTNDLYTYDEHDRRYYLGKCKFTMNIDNTEVRFYNLNNPRHGYWTEQDPHPHVDGDGGKPCLGSVATTIAELCANTELYALSLICIDFLENANISDPAGAKVISWDEVDDDGNIIREGRDEDEDNQEYCECCEEHWDEDDMYGVVYDDIDDDGEIINARRVCQNCRDDHYYYSEHFEATINCDIDEDDYIEDEEDEDDEF